MEIGKIENYIKKLREDEIKFKGGLNINKDNGPLKNLFSRTIYNFYFFTRSIVELFILKLKLTLFNTTQKKIVYTAYNFTVLNNGVIEDRISKALFYHDIIFINQSKEKIIDEINKQKVYNIGGVSKLISFFIPQRDYEMRYFRSYQLVNNFILGSIKERDVYLYWFYDLNSLSIIFSKLRKYWKLIEIQHGSIINYPPYVAPAPIKMIDLFYVKNLETIDYLKNHFCKHHSCDFRLIPYPKSSKKVEQGIHILYASTVDFNGPHPVFVSFLKETNIENLHIQVRLHPRERNELGKKRFVDIFDVYKIPFSFDTSANWLETNKIENLIVISPWSSTIEDAYDNGYTTVIIDPAGRDRYSHIIDGSRCLYSDDLCKTIEKICV